MRIELKLKGETVGFLAASSKEDADLKLAKKRLPDVDFDSVEIADEEALAKEEAEKLKAAEKAQADYLASEEYILEAEFQAELKAEADAAIEEKRKAFMAKRQNKK